MSNEAEDVHTIESLKAHIKTANDQITWANAQIIKKQKILQTVGKAALFKHLDDRLNININPGPLLGKNPRLIGCFYHEYGNSGAATLLFADMDNIKVKAQLHYGINKNTKSNLGLQPYSGHGGLTNPIELVKAFGIDLEHETTPVNLLNTSGYQQVAYKLFKLTKYNLYITDDGSYLTMVSPYSGKAFMDSNMATIYSLYNLITDEKLLELLDDPESDFNKLIEENLKLIEEKSKPVPKTTSSKVIPIADLDMMDFTTGLYY